jgi:Ohr subfamily peroxiredoxin
MTPNIIQMEKVLYTAKTHTAGGREGGTSRTSDGRLDVKLTHPGTPGTGTNPEQLFAAGWSACFLSAIKLAEVDLGTGEGGYLLQARLNVNLPGIEPEVAQKLVDTAHATCPYSKATRGNINVAITVKTERAQAV